MSNPGRTLKHYIELALESAGVRLGPDERMELIAAAEEIDRAANAPDPLGEALNSGDGTYKP